MMAIMTTMMTITGASSGTMMTIITTMVHRSALLDRRRRGAAEVGALAYA
jgi:hypothetical protein